MDIRLFKMIGLLQTLNPDMSTDGNYVGRCYRTVMRVVFVALFLTIVLNIGMLYQAFNDFQRFTYLIMLMIIAMNSTTKAYVLMVDTDRLWVVLDLTHYAFTWSGRFDWSRLSRCSVNLSVVLRTIITINNIVTIIWMIVPFFVHEPISVIHLDGTIGEYRTSILNLWLPQFVSNLMYNSVAVWSLFYAFEMFMLFSCLVPWYIFDCYLITVCFALNAHFRTLAANYEALGRTPCNGLLFYNN